jgi:transcriptional regulator with XRE-family HTH domain
VAEAAIGSWPVDKVTGLLGPRRRIAVALRRLREGSGKKLNDVAAELLISSSKLSRLENAQGKPLPRDIRDLIRYYGVEGSPVAGRLQRWVAAAQIPGWWTDYDDDILDGLDTHLAYETDAAVARVYTVPFVPVLLQTDQYAQAIYRDMEHRSEDQIQQLMAIRRKRQEALRNRRDLPPLQLVAVTHESSLRQTVGSPQVLREQLDTLVEHSNEPNVSLHVLPFSAKPVFTMTCMYAYFEYQDAFGMDQDVVHIETHAGFWSIDKPDRVATYRSAHEALVRASLNEHDSREFIRSIRDTMQTEP